MILYLHDDKINASPRIGIVLDKFELYRYFAPRRKKDTDIKELEKPEGIKIFMTKTPVMEI